MNSGWLRYGYSTIRSVLGYSVDFIILFDKPLAAKAPEREQYHHRSEGKKANIFRIISVIIN